MALKHEVTTKTEEYVRIAYVNRHAARFWNERRGPSDIRAFCGWFWILHKHHRKTFIGPHEGGPFPTPSAAVRDAYYAFVLKRDVPGLGMYADKGGT